MISNERAKISFYLLATSSILNLLLNLLFILVLQLGVLGSALGTVLAQGITMLVTLYLLAKMDRQEEEPVSLKPDLSWTKIKSILHIALPTIFRQFAITFGATLVQAWVNPFGQEAILGYVAIVKVMRIVLVGFAQTLTLMTAQLLAAKRTQLLKQFTATAAMSPSSTGRSAHPCRSSSASYCQACSLIQAKTRQLTPSTEFISMLLSASSFSPSSSS